MLVVGSLGRDVEAYPKPLERQFVCKFSDARDERRVVRAARVGYGPVDFWDRVFILACPLPARCWSGTVELEPTFWVGAHGARRPPRALEPAASCRAPPAPRAPRRAACASRSASAPS